MDDIDILGEPEGSNLTMAPMASGPASVSPLMSLRAQYRVGSKDELEDLRSYSCD